MSYRGDGGRGGERGRGGDRGRGAGERGRGGPSGGFRGGPPGDLRGGYGGDRGGGRGFGDRGGRGYDRGGGRGFDRGRGFGGDRGGGFRGGRGGGFAVGPGGYTHSSSRVCTRSYEHGSVFNPGPASIDARVADKSEDALVAAFKQVKLNTGDMPPRPDFGTEGMEIKVCADLSWTSSQKLTLCAHQLRANFFAVKLRAPEQPLKFYEAEIAPAAGTAPRRVKRRIWHLAEETPAWTQHGLKGQVAHDHAAKLVSVSALYDALPVSVVNAGVVLTLSVPWAFVPDHNRS
jgi:eukaryotic translation initiation factor 2C